MSFDLVIRAAPSHSAAIRATFDLLRRLKIDAVAVGRPALAAWLGDDVVEGSVDVLAGVTPEAKNQIPMMASHRGFTVDRAEIDAAEELDLIPMRFEAGGKSVRIHVLMTSNALYGRMLGNGVEAQIDDATVRVAAAEDLALMLLVEQSEHASALLAKLRTRLGSQFDIDRFNRKLVSIGLPHLTLSA